ncbi:hypothetical protein HN51_044667, partial [Arachis hypogaea]
MWLELIQKAKEGGLDVIQTYVFWNGHEPSPGKNWKEIKTNILLLTKYFNIISRISTNLVKFIKVVQQAGLYVNLRIGPYICSEWNFGAESEKELSFSKGDFVVVRK